MTEYDIFRNIKWMQVHSFGHNKIRKPHTSLVKCLLPKIHVVIHYSESPFFPNLYCLYLTVWITISTIITKLCIPIKANACMT